MGAHQLLAQQINLIFLQPNKLSRLIETKCRLANTHIHSFTWHAFKCRAIF